MGRHLLVHPGFTLREDLGDGKALLHYPEGPPAFEHVCATWPDPQEPDGLFVKVVAPRLQEAHRITGPPGSTTTAGSIACPDCGAHGWARAGRWVAA